MTAFYQHGLRPQRAQRHALLHHVVARGGGFDAQQMRRLGQVRGQHRGQRQQPVPQGRNRVGLQQGRATLGDHHRVQHDGNARLPGQ